MRSRLAIAQYEATVVLVVISLSLASVLYAGLKRESSLGPEPVFVDEVMSIGGSTPIERVSVNSSSSTEVSSLEVDAATSSKGILAFNGSAYVTLGSLCAPGVTTFFSVLVPRAGTLTVATNGVSWVSGEWGDSVSVSAGWQEVMIEGGTSCSITLPGGQAVPTQWSPPSRVLSSIPVVGTLSGTAFTFYVPTGGGRHMLLMTSAGGFEVVEI